MKSIAELAELRAKALEKVNMRDGEAHTRVVVGMATCGIAAGARDVMTAFCDALENNNVYDITVEASGCMGSCAEEPMVEIIGKNGEKTTYVKMTAEKAAQVVAEHIVNGKPVAEFTK